jgi:hypothetical protein
MAHNDFKEGWGVVDHGGLNIRTVSDTRRAAIVNWLVTEAMLMISNGHTDDHINALWDASRGEASVRPVRLYVQ